MKAGGHFISSVVGAGLIYSVFSSFISAMIFFISSFFIDLDHIFDFVCQYGLSSLNMHTFFEVFYESKSIKAVLVLHSFELLLILWIVISVYRLNIYWIVFALGFSIHLIIDQFTNRAFALSYFFTYRWIKHFKMEELFVINERGD